MAALAVALGLVLGAAGPVSLGALSTFQIAQLVFGAVKGAPGAIKTTEQLIALINSPQFRAWAAANGEDAIRLQPGISTER